MHFKTRHQTEAIVLRSYNYGDYDRIVRFFTLDYGKIAGIAKGAKNSRRRFPGTLEPWCLSRLSFTQTTPEHLVFLEYCEPMDYFMSLRNDPLKSAHAARIGEMVEAFSPERKRNEELFTTFHAFLFQLDRGQPQESILRCFEVKVLSTVGYAPALDSCVVCRWPLSEKEPFYFVAEVGGIKCSRCLSERDASPLPVSVGTLKSLLYALELPLERIPRLSFSPHALKESRLLVEGFVTHLLGRKLKSTRVMEQLERN